MLAAVCLVATDWESLFALPLPSLLGLIGLLGITTFSEALSMGLSIGHGGGGQFSITFLPLLASVQLFGVAGGLVMFVPALTFAEFFVRRKSPIRATFNVAQIIVSTTIAGLAWRILGGGPLEGVSDPDIGTQLLPFIAFGLTFLAINHAAVSLAITLSQGLPFRRVWQQAISNSGANLNDLLISPIALAVAFLYVQFGLAGIMVLLLPMLFIRHSYLTTNRLRESNSDLLTALVKAIEIRDPYTSGHSQRVSHLAQRIAEELGLSRLTVQRVKDAALLHDIGKIEAAYTDILRKPDSLTTEERRMIESHVERGVQLLRDLSSVHEDVVRAVRHHHEREDGNGYPDGLLGDEIPIGAKIIVVCDAVDAMLSDRPYRRALQLTDVLTQLQEHAGRQFDHRVVRAIMRSDILADYAAAMRDQRDDVDVVAARIDESTSLLPPAISRVPAGVGSEHSLRRYH
jgi:putative nucleotidyltransferase with HDIG domain